MPLWTEHNPKATPRQMAARFAAIALNWPRQIDVLQGEWLKAGGYSGTFNLANGVRTYTLKCDRSGSWTVDA